MRQPSVYGRVSQISAIYLFLCVFYAILRCKSFKIRANVLIELLKIYKNMVLTSFLNSFQPPSIRISLILHLNSVHIKPQQLNRFDSCTDTAITKIQCPFLRFLKDILEIFFCNILGLGNELDHENFSTFVTF